jgi:hypothetical protein
VRCPLIDKGDQRVSRLARGAAYVLDVIAQWTCGIFGMLLFFGRPLLRLRWWYAWVVFIAAGVIVLILVSDIRSVKPVLQVETTAETGLVAGVAGVARCLVRRADGTGRASVRR